jgi:hypothetical protein
VGVVLLQVGLLDEAVIHDFWSFSSMAIQRSRVSSAEYRMTTSSRAKLTKACKSSPGQLLAEHSSRSFRLVCTHGMRKMWIFSTSMDVANPPRLYSRA